MNSANSSNMTIAASHSADAYVFTTILDLMSHKGNGFLI